MPLHGCAICRKRPNPHMWDTRVNLSADSARCPPCSPWTWGNLVPAWPLCWPTLNRVVYPKALFVGLPLILCGVQRRQLKPSYSLVPLWPVRNSHVLPCHVECWEGRLLPPSPPCLLSALLFHISSPFPCWDKHRDTPSPLTNLTSILERQFPLLAGTSSV